MILLDLLGNLFFGLIALIMGTGNHRRGSLDEMTRKHPRSTVRRTELVEGWMPTGELRAVAFVVASPRRGLSFHDSFGHQEASWGSEQIERLELLSKPGDDGQHIALIGPHSRTLLEFWCPEGQGDVHADLTEALRR